MSNESNALVFSSAFLVKTPPNDPRIQQLAQWGKKLHDYGTVKGTEGNMSFRTRLGFIITGTDISLDSLTPETVSEITGVVYGLNKTSVYVKGAALPSRETILHSQIYEARDDVNVIFHVHDAQVMSKAEKLGITVTDKEQPAGSPELVKEAINLLKFNKDIKYFILRNHGCVILGGNLDEAGNLVEEMRAKIGRKK
jgi:ribulose-5-phosphate 4-epimerase/fuculose-1-phosphate aldolase